MIISPQSLLKENVSILIVGVGGTGSYISTLIGQMAFSMNKLTDGEKSIRINLLDDDIVTDSNIGRANFYPCDVGLSKAEVIEDRISHALGVHVSSSTNKLTMDSFSSLSRYDLIITCVDSGELRYQIGKYLSDTVCDTLWVDVGNGKDDGQVVIGHLGRGHTGKYPNVYDLFGDTLLQADDDDSPSCSLEEALTRQDLGVNYHAASRAFNAVWQLIRYGKLQYSVDFFSFSGMEDSKVAANSEAWATFGYSPNLN